MVNIDELMVTDIKPAKNIKVKVLDNSMQPLRQAKFNIAANDGEGKEYETDDKGIIAVVTGEKEGGTKLKVKKVYTPATN